MLNIVVLSIICFLLGASFGVGSVGLVVTNAIVLGLWLYKIKVDIDRFFGRM